MLFVTAGLLVDGFIASTFGSKDTNSYIHSLLKTLTDIFQPSSLPYNGISHHQNHQGSWYIPQNLLPPHIPFQAAPLLDYSVTECGTVVPQKRWTPASPVAVRQNIDKAPLQLPIFFVNNNGGIGFPLPDILDGYVRNLHNANDPAPAGPKPTTHIRIWVSPSPIY